MDERTNVQVNEMEVSIQLGPAELKNRSTFLNIVLEKLNMMDSGQNSSHICSHIVLLKGSHHIVV